MRLDLGALVALQLARRRESALFHLIAGAVVGERCRQLAIFGASIIAGRFAALSAAGLLRFYLLALGLLRVM